MSSSSAEDAVNTRSVPRATVVRAVLTVAISALLTGVLFSYFYIEVFNAPEPHRLPVAVVGADASRLQDAVGDGYRLVQMTRREEGLERLSRHEVLFRWVGRLEAWNCTTPALMEPPCWPTCGRWRSESRSVRGWWCG